MALSLSNLVYMENPYGYKKCQWRITARPRTSTQADIDVRLVNLFKVRLRLGHFDALLTFSNTTQPPHSHHTVY